MSEQSPSINPNQADVEELTRLPGVGESLAGRIIEHRPFTSIEEMQRVPGLGAATLERMRTMLTFDVTEQVSIDIDEVDQLESMPDLAPTSAAQPQEPAEAHLTRSQVLGISAAAAGVGVIVSILLVLSIFIGINRTLNYSRHAVVREWITNVDQLEDRLEDIDARLAGVDNRLEAIEGLSGRMTAVENQLLDLGSEVEAATVQVEQMRVRLEETSQQIEEMARQSENQATFFERLQELLDEVFGSAVEENVE